MSDFNNLDFCLAEVLDTAEFNTYKSINESTKTNYYDLFSVVARLDGYVERPIITAKPINTTFKKIPIVGEIILVFKIKSSIPTIASYNQEQWYYISTVDINSSINHNSLSGYTSNVDANDTLGKDFTEKSISPLQPYEGDVIAESRWGSSIRLSSTIRTSNERIYTNSQDSIYTGDRVGDPVIIISNGRENKPGKEFITENLDSDKSSIWLTSSQRINKLKLNNIIRVGDSESKFNKSQFIAKADRIILTTNSDSIVLDSKQAIELNSKLVSIGVSDQKEPILHSTSIIKLLEIIIRTLQSGYIDATGMSSAPINTEIFSPDIVKLLNESVNRNILIDKHK